MSNTDHKADLQALLLSLDKEFGKGYVNTLDGDFLLVPRISTGSLSLDIDSGGGFPVGKVTVITGWEGSGKSTAMLHAIAKQSQDKLVAIVDTEHALNMDYLENLGVNKANCLFVQPDDLESAIEVTMKLVESGKVSLLGFDSIAASAPKKELQGELEDHNIGVKAKLMGKLARMIVPAQTKSGCTVIFVNQIRMKPGVVFGSPETEPASIAINYAAFLKMKFDKGKAITNKDGELIGHTTKIQIVKNKGGSPKKGIEVPLMYGWGFDPYTELLELGPVYGVIKKAGAYYSVDEVKMGNGNDAARQFLVENPEFFQEVWNKVLVASGLVQ